MGWTWICLLLLCIASGPKGGVASPQVSTSLMSIDLGSDFLKVGLVQADRIPISVAVNEMSKRKTPAVVGFPGNERVLGEEAVTMSVRYPDEVVQRIRDFVQLLDQESADAFQRANSFGYKIVPSNRTSLFAFENKEGHIYTLEEILASVFSYAQRVASSAAHHAIRDCVILVPAHFGPRHRRVVLDAAELANLSVMTLINSHAAAALQYGITRTFSEPELAVVYDMGGSDVVAALVQYGSYNATGDKGVEKVVHQLEVLDVVWDDSVGGFTLDDLLLRKFAAEFAEKHKEDPVALPKAMAKLRKQVRKTKEVLSANANAPCHVEDLLPDKNLDTSVSRADFEAMAGDFPTRAAAPLASVLERAGEDASRVKLVELVGGTTRVPMVQAAVAEVAGSLEVGKHIDADEGMVMGAGMVAANMSTVFRLRQFGLADGASYAITYTNQKHLDWAPEVVEQLPEGFFDVKELLPFMKRLPAKRAVTFTNVTADPMPVLLEFSGSKLPRGAPDTRVMELEVTGLAAVAEEEGFTGKVSVHFKADQSGMLKVEGADCQLEKTVEGGPGETKVVSKEEADKLTAEGWTIVEGEPAEGDQVTVREAAKKPTVKKVKRELNVTVSYDMSEGLTAEQLKASREVLVALQQREMLRKQAAKAKNQLEEYIISMQSKVENDEELTEVSTEEQRTEFIAELTAAEDWLYTSADDLALEEYQKQLKQLKKTGDAIELRASERTERPAAVEAARGYLEIVIKSLNAWQETKPWLTDEDRKELQDKVDELQEWLDRKETEQAGKALHEPPAFQAKTVRSRKAAVEKVYEKLSRKKAPKPPKPEKEGGKPGGGINLDGVKIDGLEGMDDEALRKLLEQIKVEGGKYGGKVDGEGSQAGDTEQQAENAAEDDDELNVEL